MNKLIYGGFIFTDRDMISGSSIMGNGMIGDELVIDTLEIEITNQNPSEAIFVPKNYDGMLTAEGELITIELPIKTLIDYTYGNPVFLYHNEILIGKFYVKKITRTGRNIVQISCVSAIGAP